MLPHVTDFNVFLLEIQTQTLKHYESMNVKIRDVTLHTTTNNDICFLVPV